MVDGRQQRVRRVEGEKAAASQNESTARQFFESRFTPFPIESSDVAAGTGFNFSLTRLLSGSWAELRYRILRHADSAVEDRSFNGWVFSAVCGVDY